MDQFPNWTRPEPPLAPAEPAPLPADVLPWHVASESPYAPDGSGRARRPSRATLGAGAALGIVGLLIGGGLGSRLHATQAEATSADSPPAAFAPPTTPGQTLPGQTLPGQTLPGQTDPLVPSPRTPSDSTSPAAGAIAAKVNPAVVDVYTTLGGSGAGAGTGMILTADGEVLTNNHVVQGATSIRVVLVTTGRTYSAKVLGTDATDDVALIQLTGASGLPTIRAGRSAAVKVGDAVVAIGNAGGVGGDPSVVTGTVTGLNRSITVRDEAGGAPERLSGLVETDAPIRPGDSGGPLVNTAAEVIGMDTAASSRNGVDPGHASGFAVPIDRALAIARQIESGRGSATVRIGVPGLLGVSLSADGSSVVAAVTSGSPADVAGLQAGDTIRSVGGRSVTTAEALRAEVRTHRPGDRVKVVWVDADGSAHTATVRLAEGPPD